MTTKDLNARASQRQQLLDKLAGKTPVQERVARRLALLNKMQASTATMEVDGDLDARSKARRAWFQGGTGVNDPKELGYPGELKYPRMEVPVGGDSREWEQKWFEGSAAQSKANHGPAGAELELKKKLQRASDELKSLDKRAKDNPELAKKVASEVAADLNEVVKELDKAGFLAEAEEADDILEEIHAFIKSPVVVKKAGLPNDVKAELLKLANELDGKKLVDEASEIDKLLADYE